MNSPLSTGVAPDVPVGPDHYALKESSREFTMKPPNKTKQNS